MAKLVRKTQKIFASGSAQNQVTSFGSIKAGAVDYTKDVADIQTEAFEGGWSSAVQDDYAPYRQDRNAVDFVTTSQLAYVFQEGLPEWDAGTTYYKGSWVKGNEGDAFSIYESLSDDNTGNALSDEEKWEKKSFGGGLEIGDIGIAPFGIDETKNKRRYLNGQVISQSQFVSFTNKIKSAIELYPSLATSETNWQAEVTNSKLGQCGKFVIDDTAGTIRLPKVVNINGLQDLSLLGGIKAESLPNITAGDPSNQNTLSSPANAATGKYGAVKILGNADDTSRFQIGGLAGILKRAVFDASLSSSTYQDNAPVQQEAVQYPYFIQVATGSEESVDVSTEIQLNNPFFFGMHIWSDTAISNVSWLISNGSYHSGATYVDFYQWLLKIHNGTLTVDGVSVKAYGASDITDYDYVINTADTTFRLPVKVKLASGNAVVGNGMTLGFTDGTNNFGLKQNSTQGYGFADAREAFEQNVGVTITGNTLPPANRTLGITTDPTKSGIETSSQGLKLYFYVGETIQDANVINAAGVLTRVANGIDRTVASDRETVVGWGMPDYSAGITLSTAINTPQLIRYDGLLLAYENSNYVQIDLCNSSGTTIVANLIASSAYAGAIGGGSALVSKGSYIKNITAPTAIVLYPLKGVN